MSIDALDGSLIRELAISPRAGVLELARRLGVARGTVAARLDKLQNRGIITGFGPDLDLAELGYGVTAFTTITVTQGRFSEAIEQLKDMPEVMEVHSVAGGGDLLCRIVARSNDELMTVVEGILKAPGVDRIATAIALREQIPFRILPLVARAAGTL